MPGIFTAPIERNRRLDAYGLDAYDTSLGDVIDATVQESWIRNPLPSLLRYGGRQIPDSTAPMLSVEEANKRYGIEGHLTFDADTPEPVAAELRALKEAELYRQSILARGPSGVARAVAELGTGFLVTAADPINLASAFIPVVGPARYALWLERAGSLLARTGVRAGVGALEGAVGAAVVEPLVYGGARSEQADYDATDSLLNLAFGTALGGGLHMGVGAVGDRWAAFRGRDPGYTHTVDAEVRRRIAGDMAAPDAYVVDTLQAFGMTREGASQLERALAAARPETREALLRAAVAHVADDRPVAVRTLARMDPALRGEMLDVGRVVEAAEADPLGPAAAAIARISPQVMEDVLFQKGEAFIGPDGDLVAEGNQYKRRMGGHEPSLGAVKLLVKHGEYSDKAGTPRQLTRADIVALPEVLRQFAPVPEMTRTNDAGGITALQWVIERADGQYVRYVLNRAKDGEMITATIHVLDDKQGVKLSEKRAAPVTSPGGLSAGDTNAGIAHRPAKATGEAARQSYTRHQRRQAHGGLSPHVPQAVFDADGRRHMVRYELVEADDLIASHDVNLRENPAFPAELQPRDRTRAAAEAQINDIVASFEPERLGLSPDAATGAPIIGKGDNVVESGNGRVLAIRRVYQAAGAAADAYRAYLQRLGFDTRTMREPVLVRRRLEDLSPDERRAFTVAAQKSGTLELSATERAMADAQLLDSILHLLGDDEGRIGDIALARNRRFVEAFIAKLPQSEQGRMLTADGNLSVDGRRRIEAALLARAYDDADLLARMLEADDDNSRAIIGALKAGRPLPTEALTRFDANQRARILDFADGELSEGARADRRKPDAIHHSVARGERAEALAARVQADLDRVVDFSEAVHRIDEDGIRHALKRHANDHLPLRREDLARIPEAVRAGEIVKADVGKTGQIGIEYRLPADGGWLHVHEELRKDKSLVFVTAYRRPDKAKPGPHGPGSGGPQRSPREGWPSPGSPRDPNMRAAPAERKSLPPELRPPAARRPETLVGWLKRQGGVNDADGWLAHMGVDNTVRPGLIAARGMNLDDAALRAWEEGFFPEFSERPTPDQLRLQIANDLGPEGTDRVRGADEGARLEWDHYDHMMAQLDRLGVDPYGKSWEDVQAAVRAARGAQRDEDALWRDAYAIIDPEGAKALDEEAAFAARTYGELLDEDVAIPTGLTDADNKPVMQSARELMDAWDDEAMTWDSAIACFGKVA